MLIVTKNLQEQQVKYFGVINEDMKIYFVQQDVKKNITREKITQIIFKIEHN